MHFAPVQGHTDAPYRHFHAAVYGGDLTYYTPFIRLEHGELRRRDLADYTSGLNENHHIVPQIIFRDAAELNALTVLIKNAGASEIDLNMGCPFPLQTGHGRGASTIGRVEIGQAVSELTRSFPEITFSVKMRLGFSSPDEWKAVISNLNDARLSHISVHPRVARQQYGGELHLEQFASVLSEAAHPVIFNGDIRTPDDAERIRNSFPPVSDIMIGRGVLGRPSLFNEISEGAEWPKEQRLQKMLDFHRRLLTHYKETLCGDAQILSKIKPFWEYAEDEIGRKAWKAIRKASNMARYNTAVASIL